MQRALVYARVLQSRFNDFAQLDDAGALAAADEIADAVANKRPPRPLTGLPISVDDTIDVQGLPTRSGAPLLRSAEAARTDNAVVARLRSSGAIVLGKTTTTEFAHSPLGYSALSGVTRNPWAPDVTCGGSSAGAGVAVATGTATVALATDVGCLLPASCTGVFGLKPTLGRISHARAPDAFANFEHLGLLARHVEDLALAFHVASAPHFLEPHTRHALMQVRRAARSTLEGAHVLVWLTAGNAHVSEEVVNATRAAAMTLRELGAQVSFAEYPLTNPDPVWQTLQYSSWAARFGSLAADERAQLARTLRLCVKSGLSYTSVDLQRALIERAELSRVVQGLFTQGIHFILTPCSSAPPVPADFEPDQTLCIDGRPVGALRSQWTPYLSLFNLSGHPAVSMPAGFAQSGAPLGVQLVAPYGDDAQLLDAAALYEAAVRPAVWP